MADIPSKAREALVKAKDLEEVKTILTDCEMEFDEADVNHIWEEIELHNNQEEEKLSLDELDAVAGGADRNWVDDGCAATCEDGSWCWSNDFCNMWDVTYDEFHMVCPSSPDRHHRWESYEEYSATFHYRKCKLCGYDTRTGEYDE